MAMRPDQLRCEYRLNPLGVDTPRPRFGWILQIQPGGDAGERQSAYQIRVASTPQVLKVDSVDLWDSGRISSPQSTHIPYGGSPLASARQVWWQVGIWSDANDAATWSEPASFTTGLRQPGDWKANWITSGSAADSQTPLPLFRKAFTINRPIQRALVFICGLGQSELHINGQTVGENVLDPAWTNYRKSCLYVTHDVTRLLQQGPNVLGVILGNGMYNVTGGRYRKFKASFGPPKLILQLHIWDEHGNQTVIASDTTWNVTPGPITFSCIYGGEDYDARLLPAGWDSPDFDAGNWPTAVSCEGPAGILRSQSQPPIRVAQLFPAVHRDRKADVTVYDLGQNMSGRPRLIAQGAVGSTVKLVTGELLDEHGRVSQKNTGSPISFSCTLNGTAEETLWTPRFSYTGFRYLEATGDLAAIKSVAGQFIHSAAEVVGEFSCSNDLFNRIHRLINAAILSNLQSIMTDCPHREKLGWLEQTHLMGPAIMSNYDVPLLYAKICADMREAQHPNGNVPTIAPEYVVFKDKYEDFSNSPEWGSAAVIDPWLIYQQYGDQQALIDNYDMMRRYVEYLHGREQEGIIDFGLSDWYDIGPGDPGYCKLTTKGLTATAVYFQDLQIITRTAVLLGHDDDAARYAAWTQRVAGAFHRKFWNAEQGFYDRGSQTAQAMPLALGMVPAEHRQQVLAHLVADIESRNHHITAGDIGFRYVIDALSTAGRSDVMVELLSRTDPPSYGAQLERGATTLTEAWDANPKNSQNHLMLGHAEGWFHQTLAGISVDFSQAEPHQIRIAPAIVAGLNWAEARHRSVVGTISCRWERSASDIHIDVEIPPNAIACVVMPAAALDDVIEAGQPIATRRKPQEIRSVKGCVELVTGAGKYHFRTSCPSQPTVR